MCLNSQCNPKKVFMGVSPIELTVVEFRVDMFRAALLDSCIKIQNSVIHPG